MPESPSNLEFEPKLAMKTTWASNEYCHLGFVPVSPRLSGMFSCLRDVNPPSSRYPFSSISRGDRYGGEPQLIQHWKQLEVKLATLVAILRVNPAPSPTLYERQYPLPSTFGYTRAHKHRGLADAILERSRNAFYPLMASVSFHLFFLHFPAKCGPLLRWNIPSGASSSKRPPPEMSSASSKRPRADFEVENSKSPFGCSGFEFGMGWNGRLTRVLTVRKYWEYLNLSGV
jgi:hypothetical protein